MRVVNWAGQAGSIAYRITRSTFSPLSLPSITGWLGHMFIWDLVRATGKKQKSIIGNTVFTAQLTVS